MKRSLCLSMLALVVAFALIASPAFAVTGWVDARSVCTTDLCGAKSFVGKYQMREPFVIQIWAGAGECLRVEVTADGGNDLTMNLVSPHPLNGILDDDSGVGLKPLIRWADTPFKGWYTLVIGAFGGVGLTRNFTVKYGRYNLGNPNCTSPASQAEELTFQNEQDRCKTHPDTGELICY